MRASSRTWSTASCAPSKRSLAYAQNHPREVRRILPTYAEISPGTAERIKLPTWRADLNRPTIGLLARLAEKYGLIERTARPRRADPRRRADGAAPSARLWMRTR